MKQPSSLRPLFSVAVIGVLAFGARADAAFIITIEDTDMMSGQTVFIVDNQTIMLMPNQAPDTDSNPGIIKFGGSVGDFNVVSLTGLSKPFLGSADSAHTDLNAVIKSGNNGGMLMINLTDTGFLLPPVDLILTHAFGGTSIEGTSLAMFDYTTTVDIGPTTVADIGLGPPAFSAISNAFIAYAGGAFTISSTVDVTLGVSKLVSFDAEAIVTPIPEPATFAYLGFSLGALALRRRRRDH